jgi:TRAP-type C4-dicarboxylate transport system permease small subunit
MKQLMRLVHGLENTLLYSLVAVLIGLAVYQIVLRNVFGGGLYWGEPLLRVVVLWLALVGGMIATREGGHISIDVLNHYLSERGNAIVSMLTSLFSAVVCFIAAYYSALFVLDERAYGAVVFAEVPAWWCEAIMPLSLFVIGLRFSIQIITGAGTGTGSVEASS